ncbi:methyltransferase domain-containing protein [Rhizohabitans arisaemae]|uniref:methyltransferase domain-containing protein n=1 Tax=Rhizohabitans arisaemae TaxID=2720610 RepID=UPI0024B08B49|nr:methyltransferase domain-containing protein [Rhizohabitans arisaemae]
MTRSNRLASGNPRTSENRIVTISQFTDPDDSRQVEALIEFLDQFDQLPQAQQVRHHTHERLGPVQGRGVDVGCGCGRAVAELSARGLDVTGIDLSPHMIETARRRLPDERFTVADARKLGLPDASLDWYRAERVYQHLADADSGLREAWRTLVPGGRILLADPDWDTYLINAPESALTRRILRSFTDSLPNGRAGTRTTDQLTTIGFVDVTVSVMPMVFTSLPAVQRLLVEPAVEAAQIAGVITPEQSREWLDEQHRLEEKGQFNATVTMFVTTARRPT